MAKKKIEAFLQIYPQHDLFLQKAMEQHFQLFFEEDDLQRNAYYNLSLPRKMILSQLKFKNEMLICGIPFFLEAFRYLGAQFKESDWQKLMSLEGTKTKPKVVEFHLPFHLAITGERVALNLLQRASSIATYTQKFVNEVERANTKISILDTRKTTPGLRWLEKYAVRVGGGKNHRLGQCDLWMAKDNHKTFFGGVKKAQEFFNNMGSFYQPLEMEIHDLKELKEAIAANVKHIMLDNFSPEMIQKAVKIKTKDMTFEISGGVRLENISQYLLEGIDAISIGALTYGAPPMDISLKMQGL